MPPAIDRKRGKACGTFAEVCTGGILLAQPRIARTVVCRNDCQHGDIRRAGRPEHPMTTIFWWPTRRAPSGTGRATGAA